jgi:hypothetical protein
MPRKDRHAARRGPDAVNAAIEELEIRRRLDETDPSQVRAGDYDLRWAASHAGDVPLAAGTDVYTPDEALERIAEAVGRELPEDPDDEYDR